MRHFIYILILLLTTSTFGQRFKVPKTLFLETKINHKIEFRIDREYNSTGGTVALTLPLTKYIGIETSTDVIQFTSFSDVSVKKTNIKTEIYSPSIFVIIQPTSFNKRTINPYLGAGIGKYIIDIPSFSYGSDLKHRSIAAQSKIYRLKMGLNLKISPRILINSGAEIISFKNKPFFIGDKNLLSGFGGLIIKFGKQ